MLVKDKDMALLDGNSTEIKKKIEWIKHNKKNWCGS